METTILDRHELDPKLVRLLESKLDHRQFDEFSIYPGLNQATAINELYPLIEELSTKIGDSIFRCMTDMRSFKRPIGIWGDSNAKRKQRNLATTLDPKFKQMIAKVTRWFVDAEYKKPDYIWINKNSNGGFPHYTSSPKLKIQSFKQGLMKVASNEQLPGLGNFTYRIQADSVSRGSDNRISEKKRPWIYSVNDGEQIRSIYGLDISKMTDTIVDGYYHGFNTDKATPPFVQNARIRKAIAVDGETNAIAQTLYQTILDPHYVSEQIWILRSLTELLTFSKGYYISCLDFNNYDETVLPEMISTVNEVLAFGHPSLSKVFEEIDRAYMNLEVTGMDAIPIGETNKVRYVFQKMKSDPFGIFGIVSGHGLTTLYGSIIGTAFIGYCAEAIGIKMETPEDFAEIMKNKGDDNIVRFRDQSVYEKFNAFAIEQDQLSVSVEIPPKFLGNEIFLQNNIGYGVGPSLESLITNSLCPEREAGHSQRKFAVYGLNERYNNYIANAPSDEMKSYADQFFNEMKRLIPDFDQLLELEIAEASKPSDIQYILNKYGLTKPEEIYYKLQYRNLPKEDLEVFGLLIPFKEITEILPVFDNLENLK